MYNGPHMNTSSLNLQQWVIVEKRYTVLCSIIHRILYTELYTVNWDMAAVAGTCMPPAME